MESNTIANSDGFQPLQDVVRVLFPWNVPALRIRLEFHIEGSAFAYYTSIFIL